MTTLEIILLIIAYTLLSISIFLGIICYNKKIETWETIALNFSLLLLIISLTVSAIWGDSVLYATSNLLTFLSMILVGLTTPLNIMAERQHQLSPIWKKGLYVVALVLSLLVILGYFWGGLDYLQYVVMTFLGSSVIVSMILIRNTKPQKRIKHIDKNERILALGFLVIVPISLFFNFIYTEQDIKIGFLLPLIFILLAANKIWDDLQRLSILNSDTTPNEQHFKNFALTEREKEIATVLTKGLTYKQIAEELHISIPTVKTHASNIYKKCGVKSKSELILLLIN